MHLRRTAALALLIGTLGITACSDDTVERLSATVSTTTVAADTAGTSTTRAPASTTSNAPPTTVTPGTAPATTTPRPGGVAPTSTTPPPPASSPVTTSRPAPLFGVPIGAATEGAVTGLVRVLGEPSGDTGWNVGCPLDSPTLQDERLVSWGMLRVLFRRATEAAPGSLQGYGFVIPEGTRLSPTDGAARLALPNGVTLGMPISQVATKLSAKTVVDNTFGWVSVTTPGAMFTADGANGSALLNAVAVPHVFSCD